MLLRQKTTIAPYFNDLSPCTSNKEKGNVSFVLVRCETALDRKTRIIMLPRPKDDKLLTYINARRKRKKETSPISLFAMKRRWTEKHIALCLWDQKTTNGKNIIDPPPCIWNMEKGNVSFFLIRYEAALDRKTYTIMFVRAKDDKRAIYHWFTSMHFE